jgi:DNA-binding protein HU-beta
MSKINQTRLTEMVALDSGVSVKDTAKVLRSLFDVVGREVLRGSSIAITNFGTWLAVPTPERQRRNPQTGERFTSPAGLRPKFTYSPRIRRALSDGVVVDSLRKAPKGS